LDDTSLDLRSTQTFIFRINRKQTCSNISIYQCINFELSWTYQTKRANGL